MYPFETDPSASGSSDREFSWTPSTLIIGSVVPESVCERTEQLESRRVTILGEPSDSRKQNERVFAHVFNFNLRYTTTKGLASGRTRLERLARKAQNNQTCGGDGHDGGDGHGGNDDERVLSVHF